MPDFVARAQQEWPASGHVSVPQQTWETTAFNTASYVRLTRTDSKQANAYKVVIREAAAGNVLWVSPGQLGLARNESQSVGVAAISRNAYQWQQLRGTGWGQLMLLGLALGVLGLGVDAAFDIGKYKTIFEVSDATAANARAVAYLLKIAGLVIVFLQATWFKKD
jgi:hypothetical protein